MPISPQTRETARTITHVAVGVIVLGIAALCQPWSLWLYRNAFPVLLAGTLTYIVTSHLE